MNKNDFMPGEPAATGSGDYFRLRDLKDCKDHTARLRVITPFISGFEGWTENNKPLRAENADGFPADTKWKVENGKKQEPRRFWATVVWNVAKERFQVFSFTQATVYRQLKSLLDNEDWGLLTDFDVTIKKSGDGVDTEYTVLPCPKKALTERAAKEWEAIQANWTGLHALYSNGHPLAPFDEVPNF